MIDNKNYLSVGAIAYPPKLKMRSNVLMLTLDQKNEVANATNAECLRLYEFYIDKKNWKHFNPTDYVKIGKSLDWTESKTKKCKDMLTKAKYLLVKKDTLKDSTKLYRILIGKEVVKLYHETKQFPSSTDHEPESKKEKITYDEEGMNIFNK